MASAALKRFMDGSTNTTKTTYATTAITTQIPTCFQDSSSRKSPAMRSTTKATIAIRSMGIEGSNQLARESIHRVQRPGDYTLCLSVSRNKHFFFSGRGRFAFLCVLAPLREALLTPSRKDAKIRKEERRVLRAAMRTLPHGRVSAKRMP